MRILFVDSELFPNKWIDENNSISITRKYNETIKKLLENEYDILDLNLDIQDAYSGSDIVRFLIQNQINIPDIYIHSSNIAELYKMIKLIRTYLKSNVQFDLCKNLW